MGRQNHHGEFACQKLKQDDHVVFSAPLLHYALPPKTIRCIAHESSAVQTTTTLTTCCSPRLLRTRKIVTFDFRRTQKLEASLIWRDLAVLTTTALTTCCLPRLCPEKVAVNFHFRKTRKLIPNILWRGSAVQTIEREEACCPLLCSETSDLHIVL